MSLKFNIPAQFTQGDRLSWFEHFPEYNPLTDTLACFIRGQSGTLDLTAVGSAKGEGSLPGVSPGTREARWEFRISTAQSNQLTPGVYRAQFVIYSGSDRKTLGSTDLYVLVGFQDLTELDPRSDDEKELEVITTAIARLVSGAVAEYRVGDRMMRYQDLAQLTERQQYLRNRICRAKNPNTIGGRNVPIRFAD